MVLLFFLNCLFVGPELGPPPPELRNVGVTRGEGLYQKMLVVDVEKAFPGCQYTTIRDVRIAKAEDGSNLLAVLSGCAVLFFEIDTGNPISHFAFEPECEAGGFVDVENDDVLEILCIQWSLDEYKLLDDTGNELWTKNANLTAAVWASDLDGDGFADFCARLENSLACFNLADGEELWRRDGNRYPVGGDVDIVEDESTFVIALVNLNPGGRPDDRWEIRSADGALIERISVFCSEATDASCHLARSRFQDGGVQRQRRNDVVLVDEQDRFLLRPQTPPDDWDWSLVDAAVLRAPEDTMRVAVVFDFRAPFWDRNLLSIYDTDGDLIYEEILERGGSLWTIRVPTDNGPSQRDFVSVKSQLHLFQPSTSFP